MVKIIQEQESDDKLSIGFIKKITGNYKFEERKQTFSQYKPLFNIEKMQINIQNEPLPSIDDNCESINSIIRKKHNSEFESKFK